MIEGDAEYHCAGLMALVDEWGQHRAFAFMKAHGDFTDELLNRMLLAHNGNPQDLSTEIESALN